MQDISIEAHLENIHQLEILISEFLCPYLCVLGGAGGWADRCTPSQA